MAPDQRNRPDKKLDRVFETGANEFQACSNGRKCRTTRRNRPDDTCAQCSRAASFLRVCHNQSGDAEHTGLQERDSPIPRAEGSKMMVAVERKRVSPPGAKELAA